MYRNNRPPLSAVETTLPASFYADPEHFRRELEGIHLAIWLWAGRAEQVAEKNAYFLLEIGGESVVVVRGEEGALHACHNVCRHRGTRLCRASSGTLPGRIQCPYHGWTYGYDGRLLRAPMMDKTAGFDRADYPLQPVAVDTWDGHVFVHLGADPPPLAAQLGDLPAKLAAWRMAELRPAGRRSYRLAANWKLIIQNYSECLHCPLLHPQLQALSHHLSGTNDPPHPGYLGGRMDLRREAQTLSGDGHSRWAPLPGLDTEQRRGVYYYALLPNLLLNLHPEYLLTTALWPRAHDRTDVECTWYFHPDEMVREHFDPSSAIEFWDLTNRQDWEVSELAQQGIGSRAYRPGPYSNREELLQALDRWVVGRLNGDSIAPR